MANSTANPENSISSQTLARMPKSAGLLCAGLEGLIILNGLIGFTADGDDTRHDPPAHDANRAHDIRDSHDNTAGDSLRIRTRTPAARPPRVRAHKLRVVPHKLPAAIERIPAPGRSPLTEASV